MRFSRRVLVFTLGAVALLATSACMNTFWKTEARAVPRPTSGSVVLKTPVKAHLKDGSTVIYREGAVLTATHIDATGESFPLLSSTSSPRGKVPLDSVVGLETFEGKVLAAPSFVVTVAATGLGALATAGLMVAIFGSCPTVYADTGKGPVLEAEGFSYAIAPLLEHRDVDPLRARVETDGTVRLELRNEALETHFINHIELLEVAHPAGTRVVPDANGQPVVVGGLRPVTRATDRVGRDVRRVLAAADGKLFASAPAMIARARVGDLDDWIDLDIDSLPSGDSVAVVLRLRNSLLNTVLLYEGVLGGRDAPNWLANGMQQIAMAIDMSRWYVRTMGMHVFVDGVNGRPVDGDSSVARLGDVGPIAFRDVAIVLPRPARNARHTRVRLRFVADNWRIDKVEAASSITRAASHSLNVAQVIVPRPERGNGPAPDSAAVRALADADDRYLETRPGQRVTLVFNAGARARGDSVTTRLIAWQGWYNEWIRGAWLAAPRRTEPFVPGDAAVVTALTRWRAQQQDFERAFYSSSIPVR